MAREVFSFVFIAPKNDLQEQLKACTRDVLSFQDFRDPINHLDEWFQKTGKPVLLADAAKMKWQTEHGEVTRNNGQWYAETLAELVQNPGCIGFHLCGHTNATARGGTA